MRNHPIERIMTTPAWVIGPASTLEEAARLMARENLHHLPVIEADRLVGILSAADLIGHDGPDAGKRRIGDVMKREPVALGRDATLQDAAAILAGGNFHSLPVTDAAGKVLGIVTSSDLILVLLRQLPGADGPGGTATTASSREMLADLESVRRAADVYLRSGHGEHEHAALVRALEKAREHLGPGITTGRI